MKYFLIGAILLVETSFLFWTGIGSSLCYAEEIVVYQYKNNREQSAILPFSIKNETVDLNTKQIRKIKPVKGNCIKDLDLSFNSFIVFPSELNGLRNLERLDLSHNTITRIKSIKKLKKLEYLDLSYNKIKGIPENIGGLKNLKTLDLGYNFTLRIIPNQIQELQHLEKLILTYTLIGRDQKRINQLKKLLPNTEIITEFSTY